MTFVRNFACVLAIVSALVTAAPSSFANVGELGVKSRLEVCCGGYFSSVFSEITVTYTNATLPEGALVYLRHGFTASEYQNGELVPVALWTGLAVSQMVQNTDGTQSLNLKKQVINRGSPSQITHLNFVIELHSPDGQITFDKGSESALGYYDVALPRPDSPCYPWSEKYCDLTVEPIVKN